MYVAWSNSLKLGSIYIVQLFVVTPTFVLYVLSSIFQKSLVHESCRFWFHIAPSDNEKCFFHARTGAASLIRHASFHRAETVRGSQWGIVRQKKTSHTENYIERLLNHRFLTSQYIAFHSGLFRMDIHILRNLNDWFCSNLYISRDLETKSWLYCPVADL